MLHVPVLGSKNGIRRLAFSSSKVVSAWQSLTQTPFRDSNYSLIVV